MKILGFSIRSDWFIAFYIAFFVMPFLSIGVYELYKAEQMLHEFAQADGTIVGNSYSISRTASGDEGGAYYPIVEFEIADGGKIRFTDGIGSLPPDYEVGERIKILYDPKNPQTARVYSWKRIWFVPVLLTCVGLLPVFVPLIIYLFAARSFYDEKFRYAKNCVKNKFRRKAF